MAKCITCQFYLLMDEIKASIQISDVLVVNVTAHTAGSVS